MCIRDRPKVRGFKPYCEGDPEICKLLKVAKKEGLPIRAFSLHFEPKSKAVFLENPNLEVLIS
jgi:sugar fermentation stimulation protein A